MTPARAIATACAALVGLLLAAPGGAQVRPKETVNFAVTGQITAIDAKEMTLTVKGPNDDGGKYYVNDKTTFMDAHSKTIAFKDVKTGWRVVLNGDNDIEKGKKVATYVEVVDQP